MDDDWVIGIKKYPENIPNKGISVEVFCNLVVEAGIMEDYDVEFSVRCELDSSELDLGV